MSIFDQLEPGTIPDDFNVVVEIPANSDSVKYELEKKTGLMQVDRFMPTAMHYPCNYGFVPGTLADDGDPADVLVITPLPVQHGCLLRCRALGMLDMTDEAGLDCKILAVPIEKVCSQYAHIQSLEDVPKILLDSITHFFENYKGLEPGKWVKINGWKPLDAAKKELENSVVSYQKQPSVA